MRYLLDTCTLCEAKRKKPDRNVIAWMRANVETGEFFVSAITIAEIKRGISRLSDDDARKKSLSNWLESDILINYRSSILPFDSTVAVKWGEICGQADATGTPRPPMDAQIVATALVNNMTVVTRNVADMSFAGVNVVNPWLPI